MAQQYANSQPASYKNFVEKIAIVGVCYIIKLTLCYSIVIKD